MHAPYRPYPGRNGGVDFYPLIRVSAGKKRAGRTRPFEALVDSGASDCIFHEMVAAAIDIKLESGSREQRAGVGGTQDVWVHPIQLFVADQILEIEAAFAKELPIAGVLGRSGFFEHFRITFDPVSDPPGLDIERVHKI
jgi:hypothetical protein